MANSLKNAQLLREKTDRRDSHSKRITVIGSSVALGVGATSYQGWAYKLGQALTARGWTYNNVSIGGNDTLDVLGRFYDDVVPTDPDVVVIGLSLANEGILVSGTANKEAIYNQYKNNMYKIVDICRQLGYKVVVTGNYPNNLYTSVEYQYVKQMNQELEASDIPYIDFMGSIDDGTGKWRAGMYSDGSHPNDVGHDAMYRSIPLSMFDMMPYATVRQSVDSKSARYLKLGNDTTTDKVLVYDASAEDYGSFTIMADFQIVDTSIAVDSIVVLAVGDAGTPDLRVNTAAGTGGVYNLAGGATQVISSTNPFDGRKHHVAVAYDVYTDVARLYVDGELIGSADMNGVLTTASEFSFLGRNDNTPTSNARGYQVSNMAVYKSALSIDAIKEASYGRYQKSSLDILCPCDDYLVHANARIRNSAQTSSYVTANSSLLTNEQEQSDSSFLAEYLVVGGGATGGICTNHSAGGGGAGGYRSSLSGESSGGGASAEPQILLEPSRTYIVTVGAGGSGASVTSSAVTGASGSDSAFGDIVAIGGGGGNGSGTVGAPAGDGGSGGGGGWDSAASATGGSGTAGQGYDGGDAGVSPSQGGAGGGGASAVGESTTSGDFAGAGGAGITTDITGTSVTYAVGGSGVWNNTVATTLPTGAVTSLGANAPANTGTASAGNDGSTSPGNGGSGIVVVRYFGTPRASGGTITEAGGYTTHVFTSSDFLRT